MENSAELMKMTEYFIFDRASSNEFTNVRKNNVFIRDYDPNYGW